MPAEDLVELVETLTPQEKEAVREFIRFLQSKHETPTSPFLSAVDEFMAEHPELLRRLAQ